MTNMTNKVEWDLISGGTFTRDELRVIKICLKHKKPWHVALKNKELSEILKRVKKKIKEFHRERTKNRCCYCAKPLHDREIETDREHIVPKGKYTSLSYNLFNLSIACKRCNMDYKADREDHIANPGNVEKNLYSKDSYLIPHPNVEKYTDHIRRKCIDDGEHLYITYKIVNDSKKGDFLYKFMRLDLLCIGEIDEAQGISEKDPVMHNLTERQGGGEGFAE